MAEVDAYGSHQPALRAIAKFMEIRSVIEFGAGLHSSRLFLDRAAFPILESLVSFENDMKWAAQVHTKDTRHTLIVTTIENFMPQSILMRADFVFVDSGPGSDRMALVKHGLTIAPIVAVHDHQEKELAGHGFKYVKGFNTDIQTVFASNSIDLSGMAVPSEERCGQ